MTSVAVLHPGSMGAAIAREIVTNSQAVFWLPKGRSTHTTQRAHEAGLTTVDDPGQLFHRADVVLSVCPPGPAADGIADLALAQGFRGTFVDANAISPHRMTSIAARLEAAGVTVVDASIIGSPPSPTSTITLYLSGQSQHVKAVADLFEGTQCLPAILDRPIGAASALKNAYSSYQKTAYVLSGLAHALAADHDLQPELLAEAIKNAPGTPLAVPERVTVGAAKAWRWIPEFNEMTDALTDADLPPQIMQAVSVILTHWADLKNDSTVTVDQALARLHTAE
jgi:3-hydroxyisobutyrate dehydrogenase-like beta-hydroxyacid dehydrogenase